MQVSSLLSVEACLKAINHVTVVEGQQPLKRKDAGRKVYAHNSLYF